MFSILNNYYQLNLSAIKVKNILGISCDKPINHIEDDLKNISKIIQRNIWSGIPILNGLIKEDDTKYYSAIFAEIFTNELIFCLHNIQFIKLNIESYCKKKYINSVETYNIQTLPYTNSDIPTQSNKLEDEALIGINTLNERFSKFLKKLGDEISFDSISISYLQYGCTLNLFYRFNVSIVSSISNKPSHKHGQFTRDFEELYTISQNIWSMMSILTYTDIFPFMMESSYITHTYNDMLSRKLNSFQVRMGKRAVSNMFL
jgi:hypothetical protein